MFNSSVMLKEDSNFQITWTPFTILINMGRLSIQNFFTIAGFLLGIKFLKDDSELKSAGVLKAVIMRYIGLVLNNNCN